MLEVDCMDAVTQHSNSILNDFGYEIRDVSGASEKVLHSLAGTTEYITKAEVLDASRRRTSSIRQTARRFSNTCSGTA